MAIRRRNRGGAQRRTACGCSQKHRLSTADSLIVWMITTARRARITPNAKAADERTDYFSDVERQSRCRFPIRLFFSLQKWIAFPSFAKVQIHGRGEHADRTGEWRWIRNCWGASLKICSPALQSGNKRRQAQERKRAQTNRFFLYARAKLWII